MGLKLVAFLCPFDTGRTGLRLEDVEYLLLDLLQLVLHLDDELLHLSLVALRAHRIDFAPDLLCDEA